ncbi:MAG: 4'-phosphopantetheinyl transferase superfamily protein, partial [Kangiellaceae bacterium]|nr:4'-phosphopantetheinyl transferase superfamily protein [Kangiellaceae bacterium]
KDDLIAKVYLVKETEISNELPFEVAFKLLDCDEKAIYKKIKAKHRMSEFVFSRAFAKIMLAFAADIPPENVKLIKRDNFGKLEVDGMQKSLNFNISHSCGAIALCISEQVEVGIDLEKQDDSMKPFIKQIVCKHFTDSEFALINSLSNKELSRHFYKMWTVKESALKALGIGLNFSMRNINTTFLEYSDYIVTEFNSTLYKLYSEHWYEDSTDYHLAVTCVDSPISIRLMGNSSVKEQIRAFV